MQYTSARRVDERLAATQQSCSSQTHTLRVRDVLNAHIDGAQTRGQRRELRARILGLGRLGLKVQRLRLVIDANRYVLKSKREGRA